MNDDKKNVKIVNKFPTFCWMGSAKQIVRKCNEKWMSNNWYHIGWTQYIITWKLKKINKRLRGIWIGREKISGLSLTRIRKISYVINFLKKCKVIGYWTNDFTISILDEIFMRKMKGKIDMVSGDWTQNLFNGWES